MFKIKITSIVYLIVLYFSYNCQAQVNIIPYPASVEIMHGSFSLDKNTSIVLVDDNLKINQQEVDQFNLWMLTHYGIKLNQTNTIKSNQNSIQIRSEKNESEKYELNIQGNKIAIRASGEGLKNAFESLKQLINANKKENKFEIPSCFIIDSARFQWRGMHLDVSGRFFDKAFVK